MKTFKILLLVFCGLAVASCMNSTPCQDTQNNFKDEEGYFSLHIREKSGKMTCYAENYFENELEDLIAEACADAKASPKNPKPRPKRKMKSGRL